MDESRSWDRSPPSEVPLETAPASWISHANNTGPLRRHDHPDESGYESPRLAESRRLRAEGRRDVCARNGDLHTRKGDVCLPVLEDTVEVELGFRERHALAFVDRDRIGQP